VRFPGNKRFAFTVCDDTDEGTVENLTAVYRFLADLGFGTTKSVWPLGPIHHGHINGETLQNKHYLRFVLWLQDQGFEISLHGVQNHHATREVIERGLEEFTRLTGRTPRVHSNHSRNRENIYWGDERFALASIKLGYNLATRFSWHNYFQGHVEGSPYFWGDLCKERITYVRNFIFQDINLDRIGRTMLYHDPSKPYVNYWFNCCDGGNVDKFCKLLCDANQDQLEAEGGVCVMFTHFALGFCQNGVLHPEFVRLMKRLSKMNGWFVPVSRLLDHLRVERTGNHHISKAELAAMEKRWALSRLGSALF
jgi:hypothetical protein